MAAALFWWQIDKGVGPGSTLSNVRIIRTVSTPKIIREESLSNKTSEIVDIFPEPQTTGQYVVLAGSFINAKNAERIFNRLMQAGIPVRSKDAMVNGQHHTHLLVGPYGHQDSAKLAVSMIREKTGLPVDYISLEAEGETIDGSKIAIFNKLSKNSALHPDQFIVLAGSFTNHLLARRVQKRLQQKKIPANIKEANEQDRTFFHVMVGPYRLAVQANNMVNTIRQETGILAESSQVL